MRYKIDLAATLEKTAGLFPDNLRYRQRVILAYQLLGFSQGEVAEELDLSVSTVELDLQKVRATLGIKKTRDAFLIALGKL